MSKLTYSQIVKLQKANGYDQIQANINSGLAWKLEGSYGRAAMNLLVSGACMLPKVVRIDAYGNRVPARDMLKAGTQGTFQNSQDFWQKVYEGEVILNFDNDDNE